jgi:hypothetical protein
MHTNLKPDSTIPTLGYYQTDDTGGAALHLSALKGKRHRLENGDRLVLAQGPTRWALWTVRYGKAGYDEYIQAHLRQPGSDQGSRRGVGWRFGIAVSRDSRSGNLAEGYVSGLSFRCRGLAERNGVAVSTGS